MPETNNQIEGSTLTNDQELYKHLNFSEEEIETDQQQKIGERIDVNDHILLDGMISNHQNEFSKLPDDIKIPSEKIRNIHDDNPMNKLLCLHQGKLYYIENLNQFKEKGKAYVIAEDVRYRKNRLFQANKKFNIYQNLVTNVKMTKNKTNGAHTMFIHPDLVCSIIRNNEIFQEAKNSKGVDRRITQPDQNYIGKGLKIGIPKYTSSNPKMTVQVDEKCLESIRKVVDIVKRKQSLENKLENNIEQAKARYAQTSPSLTLASANHTNIDR